MAKKDKSSEPQYPTNVILDNQKWKPGEVPTGPNGEPTEYSAYGYVFDAGTPYPKDEPSAASIAQQVNQYQLAETPQMSLPQAQANARARAGIEGNIFQQQQLATQAPAPLPTWDPLALQAMWSTVFGPVFNQVAKIQGGSGSEYLNAMNNLISGSNQPAAAKAQDTNQADAMAQILQSVNKGAAGSVAAQPTFDSLVQALQHAASSAQLYQGEAQKAIAYGTNANAAQAFTNPTASGGASGQLSPTQTAALLQSALTGAQTANPLTLQRPPASVTGG